MLLTAEIVCERGAVLLLGRELSARGTPK